jgi:hypothetical protein
VEEVEAGGEWGGTVKVEDCGGREKEKRGSWRKKSPIAAALGFLLGVETGDSRAGARHWMPFCFFSLDLKA